MTPATFTVSVKHYLRGFESESVEITLAGIPANIDMAELDAINERAGRVAQALTVQIRTGEPPKPVTQAAPQAVNNSIFDDDDIRVPGSTDVSGPALAAPHAPENSAISPSAGQPSGVSPDASKSPESDYDPHADTDEIRPETLAAIAAEEKPAKKSRDSETSPFSLMRPEGHPEYCRCGECFDPFHDDAPKHDDAAHPAGCACLKCNPIKCAMCGKLKTPEATFVHIAKLGNVYNCLTCYQGGDEEKRTVDTPKPVDPKPVAAASTGGHALDDQGTCTICGGNKTTYSLTTECCKRVLGAVEAGMVVNGKLDFKNQRWGDPSTEPKALDGTEPKESPVPCHRCAEPVFGGGVTVAGNVYCHTCVREKDQEAKAETIEVAQVDIPEDVKTTIPTFGIEVPYPPIEWAAEPMTKSGGESDGGQCKALNTVLSEFGYSGGDRHHATLAIIAHFNPMRAKLDSLNELTRAEAHFALEWLDRAKGNEDAAIALHVDASARKGQIPLFNPKVKETAAA